MTAMGNLLFWLGLGAAQKKAKGRDCSAIASCRKRRVGCASGAVGMAPLEVLAASPGPSLTPRRVGRFTNAGADDSHQQTLRIGYW
jgi:hypothetical protein